MPASEETTRLFVGDLSDPWASAIASAIPQPRVDLSCVGDLPDEWPGDVERYRVVVLHRPTLSQHDIKQIEALRNRGATPPRVILCAGPNVRYYQLERCSSLVDVLLSDATAIESVARHAVDLPARDRRDDSPPPVVIRSTNGDLRTMLADTCRSAGYPVENRDAADSPAGTLVVWDVPILEDVWEAELRRLADRHRLIALIGFPDRAVVQRARRAGAVACLELPCDPMDLIYVLDRASRRAMPGHAVPPEPHGFKFARNGSSIAGRAGDSTNRNGD